MNAIVRIDTAIFRIVNGTLTAGWLDAIMPFVTEKFNFAGAIIIAALMILVLGKRKDRIGLAVLILVVGTSDLATNLLKHLLGRIRPCNALEDVRLLVGCGTSYSLPSGHATNIFAAMVFLTGRYRRFFPLFLGFAAVVAYSRVYVGVHYPIDIITGAALGTTVALAYMRAEAKILLLYKERCANKRESVEEEI